MGREKVDRSETLANELREVSAQLTARLRAASSSEESPSLPQTSALARLHKLGPTTVADLARAEHVKPQSMSVTVASLEEEGFVVRKNDPDDGRRVNISLTDAGKRALLAGRAARQQWLKSALDEQLTDAEQKQLQDGIALLKRVLGQ